MEKVQRLLQEIDQLDTLELELILRELQRKVEYRKRMESLLCEIEGSGKGVWEQDAQAYITSQRVDEREQ